MGETGGHVDELPVQRDWTGHEERRAVYILQRKNAGEQLNSTVSLVVTESL